MYQAKSISIGSLQSFHLPYHNNLTFHQIHLQSSQQLQKSFIKHLPGSPVNLQMRPELMLILQAAEIERLTLNLHEYRMKLRRLRIQQQDANSFKNQANELLAVKDQLQFKNKKIFQYAEHKNGEITDQFNYIQLLENKYKRSLRLIEETLLQKQSIQVQNTQMTSQHAQLTSQYTQLNNQHTQLSTQHNTILAQLQQLQEDKHSFQYKLSSLEAEFNNLQQQYCRQHDEMAVLKQAQKNLWQQNEGKMVGQRQMLGQILERQGLRFEQERRKHMQMLKLQKRKAEVADKDMNILRQQLIGMRSQVEHWMRKWECQSLERKKVQEQNDKIQQGQERSIATNNFYASQLDQHHRQAAITSATISHLTTKINELRINLEEKNSAIRILETNITQLREQQKQEAQSAIKYHQEIHHQKQQTSALQQVLNMKDKQMLALKQQIREAAGQREGFQMQWEEERRIRLSYERMVNELNESVDGLNQQRKEWHRKRERELQDAGCRERELMVKLQEIQAKHRQLSSQQMNKRQHEIQVFEFKSNALQTMSQIREFQFILTEKDYHLDRTKKELLACQDQLAQRNTQQKGYQREIDLGKEGNEQMEWSISKLKNQLRKLIEELDGHKEQVVLLEAQIDGCRQQIEQLRIVNDQREIDYDILLRSKQALQSKLGSLLLNLQQYEILRLDLANESERVREQLEHSQRAQNSSKERASIMEYELEKAYQMIHSLKESNNILQASKYELQLWVEKGRKYQGKVKVLSAEIDRLQQERIQLIQELNLYKLQVGQESSMVQSINERNLLLVVVFAEIESLRERVSVKEGEVQQLRRMLILK